MLISDIHLDVKPLSVNDAWQGKRFKTDKYKSYEQALLWLLPKGKLPEPPYSIDYEFGFSNKLADFDNPCKPLGDILQKKYGFNSAQQFVEQIDRHVDANSK